MSHSELQDLDDARNALATITRICAASGVRMAEGTAVDVVRLLAREHAARGAMNVVLNRQTRRADDATMYTSEPLPDVRSPFYTTAGQYYANEESCRRAQLELDAEEQLEQLLTDRALTATRRALVAA